MSGPDPDLLETLATRIAALPSPLLRHRVAIVGPPGAGKSTLAEALVARLNRDAPVAVLVPMDGFHLDNAILDARGLRHRKGAPETFDSTGFVRMVERLGTEEEVVIPVFDRVHDMAIAGAAVVTPAHRIAVVEGNYLLLPDAPWNRLAACWDLTVALRSPFEVLRQRLIERWLTHGHDPEAARARAESNDLPNARRVLDDSLPADIVA